MKSATLVIPSKNRNEIVKDAIVSAKVSGLVDEIIVVDDGSEPSLQEYLFKWSGMPDIAKVIVNPGPPGAVSARRAGAIRAKNDVIVFLDSDDILEGDGVDRLIEAIYSNPSASIAYGNLALNTSDVSDFLQLNGNNFRAVLRNLSLCPFSGLVARRSLINWPNLDDALPAWQDDDFCLEASRAGDVVFVNTVCARMRTLETERISSSKRRQYDGLRLLLRKWKSSIIAETGVARWYLWQLRLLVLSMESTRDALNGDRSLFNKTLVRGLSFISRRLRAVLGRFFDRMYA